jgi:hypothetical protein
MSSDLYGSWVRLRLLSERGLSNSRHLDHEAGLNGATRRLPVAAFGPFRLRATERLLEKDGIALKIGSRALDILIALVERAPEVVIKQELISRVWGNLVIDESSLRWHIASLRKSGAPESLGGAYRLHCFGTASAPLRHRFGTASALLRHSLFLFARLPAVFRRHLS